ncbi:MAG TPA: metallophosphoesterase [Vicinamibacterales bacterium]|nr:metallophosphoesterase [Vicinamibacterales bacterium]
MAEKVIRIAAVGDLHCTRTSHGVYQALFARIADSADLLLLAGDLTDHGHPEEARVLARDLSAIKLPIVGVFGNHDFESNQQDEMRRILADQGITILDGDACESNGIGIAGVKGFAGGFGQRALGAWGEAMIKSFVHEAVNEGLKLEAALRRLRTSRMVVLLHYAPIQQTVVGEPLEIYPFLGSSRLEDPVSRYPVTLVFHGHAHRGQPEGRTRTGVPVYNVSHSLLERLYPDRPPFRLVELQVNPEATLQESSVVEAARGHN